MLTKSIWDLLPAPGREESRAVWRLFQDTGRLRGSITILTKQGERRELQYHAVADVIRGAHLSVFIPHPLDVVVKQSRRYSR